MIMLGHTAMGSMSETEVRKSGRLLLCRIL